MSTPPRRVISGIKPTGHAQLGNYLGAIRRWVADQRSVDGLYFVVDLHAMTVDHDPAQLRAHTDEMFALLLACGLEPGRVFVQSDVPAHTELSYLLECVTTVGEAQRMIQFKEKAGRAGSVRLSLLTYPVLMAADILIHGVTHVPVGSDQSQHVELARAIAIRFNHRYGPVFTVPELDTPGTGARIMDLADPSRKMEKSGGDRPGVVYVLDPPEVIAAKVRRAVTDTVGRVRHDPANQPGVANLLEILGAATDRTAAEAAAGLGSYADLKGAVTRAVVDALTPVRNRYAELVAQPEVLALARARGARLAGERAAATLRRVRAAIGLAPTPAYVGDVTRPVP